MIIDLRIYASILVPLAMLLLMVCFIGAGTIDNDRSQMICGRIVVSGFALGCPLLIALWLDWLWS